jgi:hypothetical protein
MISSHLSNWEMFVNAVPIPREVVGVIMFVGALWAIGLAGSRRTIGSAFLYFLGAIGLIAVSFVLIVGGQVH